MMRPVIVGRAARIGSFRNISMLPFIPNPRPAKAGGCLLETRFPGASSSCSTLGKSFPPIVSKAGPESSSTAAPLART
jgi:hypothetical protein